MSDKSSRWAFTAYENQWKLFEVQPPGVAEWGWQEEICPETNRKHYQGYLRLAQQQRLAWVRKVFPGVHVEIARDWNALINYCSKSATSVPGTQVHQTNNTTNHYQYAQQVARTLWELERESFEDWTLNEALLSVDTIVRRDISEGNLAVSWIASNPAWLAMWRKYWREYISGASRQTDRQTPADIISPASITPDAPQSVSSPPQPQTSEEDAYVQTWT